MEMLAQGGYIVGHMASLYYPDGIHVEGNTDEAVAMTQELMTRDKVITFEPTFIAGQKVVRVDILIKNGDHLQIIEVKSKKYKKSKEGYNL